MKLKISIFLVMLFLLPAVCFGGQLWIKPDGKPISSPNVDETGNLKVTGSTNTAIGSLTSSSTTAKVSIYTGETIRILDEYYSAKASTQTIGRMTAADTTLTPAFTISSYSFKIKGTTGGTWTSNLGSGTGYLIDDLDVREPLPIPKSGVNFIFTIPTGTTVYYIIKGVN